jgi:putative NIF3 family GTP cyclohydrolase 1 type 2
MKVQEIYNLALEMGKGSDFRGKEAIEKVLAKKRKRFEKLSEEGKKDFDQNDLVNPFSDSRILHLAEDKEIKKVLVGIDIEPAEVLLAKEIGGIDLIISHHPLGKALATLAEVMELQSDVLASYGVPINIAEGLMTERISEVARGLNAYNHGRTVDAAKLLNFNLICLHTVCDNLAASFLKKKIEEAKPERLGELIDLLKEIPEYKTAEKLGSGPKIFVGGKESRCGKIALTEITGGTEGSPRIYEKMAQAGIGTVVGMHIDKEHWKEAKAALINVVIAGHISSDSLGVNLFLDELERHGIEIVPCSGLTRISRPGQSGFRY